MLTPWEDEPDEKPIRAVGRCTAMARQSVQGQWPDGAGACRRSAAPRDDMQTSAHRCTSGAV